MAARKWLTDKQKKQIIADRVNGLSLRKIAEKNGVSTYAVIKAIESEPDFTQKITEKKEQNTLDMLAYMDGQKPKIQQLLANIVEALDDPTKLARANVRDLATAYGIIYDKITASAPKTNEEYLQKARDILGNIHGVIE